MSGLLYVHILHYAYKRGHSYEIVTLEEFVS